MKTKVRSQFPSQAVVLETEGLPQKGLRLDLRENPFLRSSIHGAKVDDVVPYPAAHEIIARPGDGIAPHGKPTLSFRVEHADRGPVGPARRIR